MNARGRGLELLPSTAVSVAAILGLIAAQQPLIAIAAAVGLVLAFVVFSSLATGFATLAFLSFLDTLPAQSSLSPSKVVGLMLAVAWLARYAVSERKERDFFSEQPVLTWALVLFLAWGALSMLWATQPSVTLSNLGRYAPDILLLPIAYTATRTRRDLILVLGAIVLGAIVAALFAVASPPPSAEIAEESVRSTGTVGDPNELAAVLLVGLSLSAGFALSKGRAPLMRLLATFAIPLCAGGIFLSLSRGGLIALGSVLVAGAFLAGRWRLAITAMLVAVAIGGVLYFTEIASLPARERVTTAHGGSGRSDLWTIGLRMFKAHPVTGVGLGNFQSVSANYTLQPGALTRTELIFSSAPKLTHNTYLQIAAETGVPGLALFLTTLVACLGCALKAARSWSRRGQPGMEALARGLLLGLFGMLVADFFISNMVGKLLWVLLALCPATLALARSEERGDVLEPA
jgi:putative inorganic carbon (hco3(-)) transporter